MTILLFVAVVVISILLALLHDKVNRLKWENSQLKYQIDQLWGFLRQQPMNPPAAHEAPAARPPCQTQTPAAPYAQTPCPPPAPPQPVAARYAGPAASPARPVNAYTPPKAPAASAVSPAQIGAPGRMENWFGRNVLGVAASILFFIGLIVFAVWVYNDIPDTVKVILMFLLSAAVTATGIGLTARRRNNFTLILTGCGSGLLFISILLTHVYFGRLNDIATFFLLLVWLAASLFLSRQLNSMLISLVAHAGMGVSLCFAYAAGLRDDKLVMLLIYQAASIVIIVAGNLVCYRKTYRFGLFLSVIMTLVAGAFMLARFVGSSPCSDGTFPLTALPDWGVAVSFFAQFLCMSFLSYLLAVSATRLGDAGARLGIHIANKALWVASLCLHVLPAVFRLAYAHYQGGAFRLIFATGVMTAAGITLLLCHALLSIFLSRKRRLDGRLETLSVVLAGCLSAVFLFILWIQSLRSGTPPPRLPLFLLPALLLLLAGWRGEKRAYRLTANLLLGCEWCLMALAGFRELTRFGTAALPLLYMALYAGLAGLQWGLRPPEERRALSLKFRIFLYGFLQVTTIVILAGSGYRYWLPSLLLTLTAANLLLRVFRYDRGEGTALAYAMRAVEGGLLFVNAGFLAFMPHSGALETTLHVLLAVSSAVYAFFRVPAAVGRSSPAEDAYAGVKFTLLTLAVIQGFTSWFSDGYILTLTVLAVALLCLVFGYARKARGLIFYGWIAALLGVAKLLFHDLTAIGTLPRLTALLGGGLLFLMCQLLYKRCDGKTTYPLRVLIPTAQHLLLAAAAIVIAFSPHSGAAGTTLSILLTVLLIVWSFLWTLKTLGQSSRPEAVLEGIKLTLVALAVVHGYTDWFANAYVLSLVCMLTSLACVIAGFIRRAGGLRLYGLLLTMVCVLKLVTWDVAGLETLLRILSLIGGGIICFVISAIYSYSVKRFRTAESAGAPLPGDDPEE